MGVCAPFRGTNENSQMSEHKGPDQPDDQPALTAQTRARSESRSPQDNMRNTFSRLQKTDARDVCMPRTGPGQRPRKGSP